MELAEALREAFETHVMDDEPTQASVVLRNAIKEHGAVEVADGLLGAGAIALRRMVVETGEELDLDEEVQALTLNGLVPADQAALLTHMLTLAASTAGGLRSTARPYVEQLGEEIVMFAVWLAALATIRLASVALEVTMSDIVEDILHSLE